MALTGSCWSRAAKDSERFRKESPIWFWGFDLISGALFATGGVVFGFVLLPQNASDWQTTSFPAIGGLVSFIVGIILAFLLVFILNLWQAPYRQRNEARIQFQTLTELIEPRLELIGPTRQAARNGTAFVLEVRNPGLEDVSGCHGRLMSLAFEEPSAELSLDFWPRDRDLHWSGQVENAPSYDVPASQRAILNVIYVYHVLGRGQRVVLAYRGPKEFRELHDLPSDRPILLLVRISSSGNKPIDVVARIDPKLAINRISEGLSSRKPMEVLWSGTDESYLYDRFSQLTVTTKG